MINIAIIPTQKELLKNRIFNIDVERDNILERFVKLKKEAEKRGYQCKTIDQYNPKEVDVLIFLSLNYYALKAVLRVVKENPDVFLIYTAFEEPVVCPLHEPDILVTLPITRILTWNDEAVRLAPHIIKCNIPQPVIQPDTIPEIPFTEKRFICAIYSNKDSNHRNSLYGERRWAIRFFARQKESIDLYGFGWDNCKDSEIQKVYKGPVKTKKEVLKRYKFSICYENSLGYPGDITEKIFDCFAAGNVPIYYGAPNIEKYIPKSCFIDFRDFKSYEELHSFLNSISEAVYQGYLDNVKKFIKTPQYREFTSEYFAEIVIQQIEQLQSQPKKSKSYWKVKQQLWVSLIRSLPFYLKNSKVPWRFIFDLMF